MKVYHYHKQTKEIIGVSDAPLDPLETERQGKKVYLKPAFSTELEPPIIGSNRIPVFEDNQWVSKRDYRGTKYYSKTGEEKTIIKLDEEPPVNSPLDPPPEGMKEPLWVTNKWEEQFVKPVPEPPTEKELNDQKIQAEIQRLAKANAIASLKAKGDLPADFIG